jgi:hypothetical protein
MVFKKNIIGYRKGKVSQANQGDTSKVAKVLDLPSTLLFKVQEY